MKVIAANVIPPNVPSSKRGNKADFLVQENQKKMSSKDVLIKK